MAAEQTKKTVMALVKETIEGTPVLPTAGAEYIALQEGFEIEPSFEELDNAEFTGSIGASKTILGFESPTVSLSHYIRHSGIEGQEPGFGLLMEGAFGAKKIVATERDTTASTAGTSSAPATLDVDAGEGVEFERGQAVLIKDATNKFEIRNVKSVSGEVLTLNFNLPANPGSGINLGKAVLYKPGESHPSLSVWNFRGNGTALELVSGAKVSELSMEINAGELINGSFSLDGIEFFFNPIVVDATNNKIDFANDAVPTELTGTITNGTYKDPIDFAAALESAMDSVSGDDITVTYDNVTGKFTIDSAGATFQILWDAGTNTAISIGLTIGFDVSADDTGSTAYIGDNALDFSQKQTPVFDDSDPLVAKDNEVFIGTFFDTICFKASSLSTTIANTKSDVLSVCSTSGKDSTLITEREVTTEIVATLDRNEVNKFKRFRTNEETEFAFNFGTKTGGNWVAGKSANLYMPAATISSFKLSDNDGIITLEMTLKAFVKGGLGEFYLNFL